jgi:hypothetical protein
MNASGLWQSASGLFDAGLRQARQAFGDDAVDTGEGKRRAPSGVTRSEDDELPVQKRRKLLSQTRDLVRNFALLGWGCVVGFAEDGIMDCDCEALSVLRG